MVCKADDEMTDWSNPAHWYDAMNPWAESDDFYLDLVMQAESVLDVGCGTGTILKRARATGHAGRLCGVDPDPEMLDQARSAGTIQWVQTDAASMTFGPEFDLVIMSGHAFQMIVDDLEVAASLSTIRRALNPGGRFAFETRNPAARAWEDWDGASFDVSNGEGGTATVTYAATEVERGVVELVETMSGEWWDTPQVSATRLRFMEPDELTAALNADDFGTEARYGNWNRTPFWPHCREIITIARVGR